MSVVAAPRAAATADKHVHDCKKAISIVQRGKPEKKDNWAWSVVLSCGVEGGVAARDAWLRARTKTDTAQLADLYAIDDRVQRGMIVPPGP